jgi:hypothetical protein
MKNRVRSNVPSQYISIKFGIDGGPKPKEVKWIPFWQRQIHPLYSTVPADERHVTQCHFTKTKLTRVDPQQHNSFSSSWRGADQTSTNTILPFAVMLTFLQWHAIAKFKYPDNSTTSFNLQWKTSRLSIRKDLITRSTSREQFYF